MINKRIHCGLILTVVLFTSTFLAQAQGAAAEQIAPPKNAIVGSWVEHIIVPGGPPPFKSVGIYSADGTLMFSDQGGVTSNPPQVFSSTAGSWTYVKERTFAWTAIALISDLDGNLVGTLKVRGETTLDQSGNRYTSRFLAEIFDTNGQILLSAPGTNEGRRVVVEALP